MSDFNANLFQLQADVAKAAIAERNRLLVENEALRKQLASMPATAYELQERVTQLEILLARYGSDKQ